MLTMGLGNIIRCGKVWFHRRTNLKFKRKFALDCGNDSEIVTKLDNLVKLHLHAILIRLFKHGFDIAHTTCKKSILKKNHVVNFSGHV